MWCRWWCLRSRLQQQTQELSGHRSHKHLIPRAASLMPKVSLHVRIPGNGSQNSSAALKPEPEGPAERENDHRSTPVLPVPPEQDTGLSLSLSPLQPCGWLSLFFI